MCLLKIFSDSFSFREFAANTGIPVYSFHDAGEVRRRSTGETHREFRISFGVSDREWDDFPGQVQDAMDFLSEHGAEIRSLVDSCQASNAYLDFPLWSRLNQDTINQNDHLPRKLVALCAQAGIGVEMAMYSMDAFSEQGNANEES